MFILTDSIRDAAVTAAIFGFFGAGWFGWAQEAPPERWRPFLIGGSVIGMLTAIAGGVQAWRHWSGSSAIDAQTAPTFGIIVGIEVALAGIGAAILARRQRSELVPAWVALVVGVHFFPLAPLLAYPLLYLVAALVTAAALVATPLARARGLQVSATTGLTVGAVLLGAALTSLAASLV
jgi:hypothetical protein